MTRVIINGAAGHMGQILTRIVNDAADMELAAAVDVMGGDDYFTSFSDDIPEGDIIIDFSHHSLTNDLLGFAVSRNIPLIIATTGQTDEEKAAITAAAEKIPLFFSANMSLGVALLVQLAKKAAAAFPDADIEIVEAHHNRKLDSPSGTAAMLGTAIQEVRENSELVYGRHGNHKREKKEIGMHSLRMGNVVGMHEVIVNTGTQVITLKHEAFDRALFADGAVSAARFMIGKGAGLYNMQDLV